jgi:hypothetical protein
MKNSFGLKRKKKIFQNFSESFFQNGGVSKAQQ